MKPLISNRIIYAVFLFFMQTDLIYAMEENAQIKTLFEAADVNATFILYDLQKDTIVGYDKVRSEKRYLPASTFKIANSLIGLATGAVKTVDEPIPYNGPSNPFIAAWKQDMGLKKAIAMSNVPIYQELARRIGLTRMQKYLKDLHYGNESVGEHVDRFWLDGPLQISAVEQVLFLKGLVQETLPFSKNIQKDVKSILLIEKTNAYRLYGKTGWQNAPEKGIGWFVGWIEKSEGTYIFAFNMDMTDMSDAPKRINLSKTCLTSLGLLNSE